MEYLYEVDMDPVTSPNVINLSHKKVLETNMDLDPTYISKLLEENKIMSPSRLDYELPEIDSAVQRHIKFYVKEVTNFGKKVTHDTKQTFVEILQPSERRFLFAFAKWGKKIVETPLTYVWGEFLKTLKLGNYISMIKVMRYNAALEFTLREFTINQIHFMANTELFIFMKNEDKNTICSHLKPYLEHLYNEAQDWGSRYVRTHKVSRTISHSRDMILAQQYRVEKLPTETPTNTIKEELYEVDNLMWKTALLKTAFVNQTLEEKWKSKGVLGLLEQGINVGMNWLWSKKTTVVPQALNTEREELKKDLENKRKAFKLYELYNPKVGKLNNTKEMIENPKEKNLQEFVRSPFEKILDRVKKMVDEGHSIFALSYLKGEQIHEDILKIYDFIQKYFLASNEGYTSLSLCIEKGVEGMELYKTFFDKICLKNKVTLEELETLRIIGKTTFEFHNQYNTLLPLVQNLFVGFKKELKTLERNQYSTLERASTSTVSKGLRVLTKGNFLDQDPTLAEAILSFNKQRDCVREQAKNLEQLREKLIK